jgi:hypothetical protein
LFDLLFVFDAIIHLVDFVMQVHKEANSTPGAQVPSHKGQEDLSNASSGACLNKEAVHLTGSLVIPLLSSQCCQYVVDKF